MARTVFRAALVAGATFACPGIAHAHFHLDEPANWITQLENGDPQKTGPCGALMETNKTYTASGEVTPFKAGDTVVIKLEETVSHPGHYRVALAVSDRSELPPEPEVTKKDNTTNGQCGSVPIMDPPVFPILADGELKDATPQSGQQTITVKLPDDIECEKCTLQVLEFMSDHMAPCFYHHCADISITKGGGTGGMSAGGMSAGGASSGGMSTGGMSAGGSGAVTSAGGMGGMTGQAGSPIVPSAGMPGVAGTTGAGGTGTATGGAGGTSTATGGTTSGGGSGGSGGSGAVSTAGGPTGTGGAGTPPATPATKSETEEDGGCSTTPRKSSSPWVLAGLLSLAALRARRRRSGTPRATA